MRFRFLTALVTFGLACSVLADARSDIQAGYDKLVAAWKANDAVRSEKAMKALATPDFTYIDLQGNKQNLAQIIEMTKMQTKATKKVDKMEIKITSFKISGNVATVTTRGAFEGVVALMDPKKPGKLVTTSTSTDTWVKTPQGWKCKTVKITKESVTFDGKKLAAPG
ncbi:MAG TPA: nuclear transport factor 2 family protein [Fimbriimonadaceae bacterium]|nr:nuclear transport factor 2 family protein [Fimbriimonadaceae bacterium]